MYNVSGQASWGSNWDAFVNGSGGGIGWAGSGGYSPNSMPQWGRNVLGWYADFHNDVIERAGPKILGKALGHAKTAYDFISESWG